MAFYGKQFKKVKFENIEELLDIFNSSDTVRALVKNSESTSRFEKNPDGSVQYIVTKGGQEILSQKITSNVESEFTTPDGIKTKVTSQIKDDRIEMLIVFPDGGKLHIDRVYDGNTLKSIVWKEGNDVKAIITYEQV